MTVEHAQLIYRMYRKYSARIENLPPGRPDSAFVAALRLHEHFLQRWVAVPGAVVAKMGFG